LLLAECSVSSICIVFFNSALVFFWLNLDDMLLLQLVDELLQLFDPKLSAFLIKNNLRCAIYGFACTGRSCSMRQACVFALSFSPSVFPFVCACSLDLRCYLCLRGRWPDSNTFPVGPGSPISRAHGLVGLFDRIWRALECISGHCSSAIGSRQDHAGDGPSQARFRLPQMAGTECPGHHHHDDQHDAKFAQGIDVFYFSARPCVLQKHEFIDVIRVFKIC
jgi:hypothetical protein